MIENRHPGQKPFVITPQLQAKVLATTPRKPKDGSTHWSCRKLAQELGISKDAVPRIWVQAGLKPYRLQRYMASNDPDFEAQSRRYYRIQSLVPEQVKPVHSPGQ